MLESTGLILTPLLPHDGATLDERRLMASDRLLIFSDGMYEVLDSRDHEWGVEGLTEALQATRDASPPEVLDGIMDRRRDHAGGRPLDDDATVVLIERLAD